MKAIYIWGSQLTVNNHSALTAAPEAPVILIEAQDICRRRPYHKQKLAFILSAMRSYADELRQAGRTVWYVPLQDCEKWQDSLRDICAKNSVDQIVVMRQNDRPPQQRLEQWCKQQAISLSTTPNTMFLTSAADFEDWANQAKGRLQMEQFYRWQRRRLNILMEGDKPAGGKWNYDAENRKPLPAKLQVPATLPAELTDHTKDTCRLVEEYFADNPGSLERFWLPTTRSQARQWLDSFIQQKLPAFGDYEDAMRQGEPFLFHSGISALLNIGLIHPSEAIEAAVVAKAPLAATEGFVRQIIGWREFMFGLYHHKEVGWKNSNYFSHTKSLPNWWWRLAGAPEPPLQDVLARVNTFGYAHHIERLMVCGNYMLLAGYEPTQVYEWFMCMFVDSYEWVMVPNVIGMSQYADGGLDKGGFATKPYISGSNYLQTMGKWWPNANDAKQSAWAGMYWQFLDKQRPKLEANYRLRPLYSRRPQSG